MSKAPNDLTEPFVTENAYRVLEKRYLIKGDDGKPVETPKDLYWRVAHAIADVERKFGGDYDPDGKIDAAVVDRWARRFYRLMTEGQFMPNSPTLMNAGRPLGQLSACFVLPVEDDLSGIYTTLHDMALIHKSGGGTGFSFSKLRPSGDMVKSTTGVASGPISFMEVYDASTEAVKQGGTRRGANMGILRVDHPDILKFIRCKEDTSKITNFNISVAVTDEFMEAVKNNSLYSLRCPKSGDSVQTLSARKVWNEIVERAHATGEPGLFFIDEANRHNPVPHLGDYEATNPCGEQPLLPYDVCNLGSINLGAFVAGDQISWPALGEAVKDCVRFLDNVIEANTFPLPQIEELSKGIRRIGLGVMGFADALIELGIPYGSRESFEMAEEFMKFVQEAAHDASEKLAEERGVFPEWEKSVWGPGVTCAKDRHGDRIRPNRRMRNCNVTTVAPTGTISMLAGCSSGIEPLYAVAFMRNQAGMRMPDVNPVFREVAENLGWHSEELFERIAEEGHIHFDEVPESTQKVFVTAHDVTPSQHVRMQAAFQRHCDSAISKTCNFPREATAEDVHDIYLAAHGMGCKGITVYRDGSRPEQVLSTGKTEAAAPTVRESRTVPAAPPKRERPKVLTGMTTKIRSPLGKVHVTINEDHEGNPFEVFVVLGKAGGAATADAEAIGRLCSLALRRGIPIKDIQSQLRGISSDRAIGIGQNKVASLPDAVAQAIGDHWAKSVGLIRTDEPPPEMDDYAPVCHECGCFKYAADGCWKCPECGEAECG